MPDTETQTNVEGHAPDDEEDQLLTEMRILLVLGVMACFINMGNAFSVDSVLRNNPFFKTNHSNLTVSPTFLATTNDLFAVLPKIVAMVATILAGFLLDRSGLGRTALLFAIGSPLGTAATMLSNYSPNAGLSVFLLIIGSSLFLSSLASLMIIQTFLALKFIPAIYQPMLFGIMLSVDYIAFVLGFWLTPAFHQNLWISFGASMISVVGASILCHIEIVASLREMDEAGRIEERGDDKASKTLCTILSRCQSFNVFFWLIAAILMQSTINSLINVEFSNLFFKLTTVYAASIIVSAPFLGLASSYFRISSTIAICGAGISIIGLSVHLVGHLVPPLTASLVGIGYAAINVSLYPLIPRYVNKDCLGIATGIIGSGGAFALTIFALVAAFSANVQRAQDVICMVAGCIQWFLVFGVCISFTWHKFGNSDREEEKILLK